MEEQDPLLSQMLQRATSIGPPQPGASLVPQGLVEKVLSMVVGAPRPGSLAAQDPYGLDAMEQGKGPVPILAGTTEPGKLEPFLVHMYKQRLKADPSLAYHPGLQALPEFQAAFSELYPTKKIVGPGQASKPSVTSQLNKMPSPPSATTPEMNEAAQLAQGTGVKGPRTLTFREMKAQEDAKKGLEQVMAERVIKQHQSRFTPDDIRMIRTFANGKTVPDVMNQFPDIPESTLRAIINGTAWNFVK